MSGPEIAISIADPQWLAALPGVEDLCCRLVAVALGPASQPVERLEVSLMLANDQIVRDLNHRYRHKDEPTNVLSFAALDDSSWEIPADGPILLGDVILAYETTAAEAARDGIPLSQHFAHLVVHGVLHLLGYDHQDEPEALEMEALESALLAALGFPDPYDNRSIQTAR
ncbi:MAG TPA: rRNA maturation RNase YbeY [Rhodospirillaceae bacterium]|nr:rRNA maturation RNase YbeY [Rhodospirillaceae bacterium]